jgi:hypothetical protein
MELADKTHCEECGRKILRGYESVNYTESDDSPGRLLCIECYNQETADYTGIDFKQPHFPPVEFEDVEGDMHLFYIVTRLLGDEISIEAYEEGAEPGYRFHVHGEAEDVQKLFRKLLGKMRCALTRQHLVKDHGRLEVSDDLTVRGRFEWDDETDGQLPLLVIDGNAVTWDKFGRILMTFEGWQFKIEIYDPSEER